ncbi:MAG: ergothioneine biosynthesis protein EgtB, partial [Enterobacterales bacterium]|nr:ergothioneine biosynthesis protein EgtB [Enterobacterales bacterium]
MLAQLNQSYKDVRQASRDFCSNLTADDMQIQSMTDTSPVKWHLAHTSWAFETFILKPYLAHYRPFDALFEYLFNSYYNAIGEQYPRAQRGCLSRPSINQVVAYRQYVDAAMQQLFEQCKGKDASGISPLIRLLINHEQQHQELMVTDLKHGFYLNPSFPAVFDQTPIDHANKTMSWIEFSAGNYPIGHQNESFYFDNEAPPHQVYLQPFKFASRLVTNGEYLQFIQAGGYQSPQFWLSEAWQKIKQSNTSAPLYWLKKDNRWYHYTLAGLLPIDWEQPVSHISYFEANAYAASQNMRLATEQEWETAARSIQENPNSKIEQIFNCLWQWTTSAYCAYPGFKAAEGAIGEYNGKFMVNQYVLRGGSKHTPSDH